MAGKWTEFWDEERQRWVKCYIEFPAALTKGSASAALGTDSESPTLFGPDGKRIKPPVPSKSIGFGKR